MNERRAPKKQFGRRETDIPIKALEIFKEDITAHLQLIIKETVNGKIDKIQANLDIHNAKHEEDMKRILPVIEAWESTQDGGRLIMKSAGVIGVVGGAYLIIKHIFK